MNATDAPRHHHPGIALVPLDERPACATLPVMVAALAGVPVRTPAALLPALRTPGDPDGIGRWLARQAPDAAVVSLETLGHGGLIASRTRPGTVASIAARLEPLRALAATGTPVHGVTLVTRTPDSDDAMEEPDYWDPHGPALHRWSAALHRASLHGAPVPETDVPDEVRADFLGRRLRNHALNLVALELVADGTLTSLVVGADDTAPHALATAELGWLTGWTNWLGGPVAVRPGADEACTTLVARTVGTLLGGPAIRVAIEGRDLDRVAPYENVPVGRTAAGQVAACGGIVVQEDDDADVRLLVHTPDGTGADWAVAPPATRADDARERAESLAGRAARLLASGHRVAVADCAQPNGADPLLVTALAKAGIAEELVAYAAWNTAGNTLGTVAAHAVTYVAAERAGVLDIMAHRRLLLHRYLEDAGYMTCARATARAELGSVPGRHDHVPDGHRVLALIEAELTAFQTGLGIFPELRLEPGSVRLPWHRTFEIDFTVTTAVAQEDR
ncbi:DUF4127 family protein [Streptomyces sp. NPDC056405]|uniref:DUF4127 family protein n=1 Tax=Streptomyces sp. NPDC056405 TaxID=3345811 RepID=UPI0035E34066